MGQWYLGPSGALVAIPQPLVGLDASPDLMGIVSTSLNGARTLYRASQPRTWQMRWTMLTEEQINYLRLVGHGLVSNSSLRLIVGEIRNRLPLRIAASGAYGRSGVDFTSLFSASPSWVAITDPPATVPVRGVLSWSRTSTAADWITPANSYDRIPLVAGEQIRVSCWARGTAVQASAAVDWWDATGVLVARSTGTAATLDPVSWTYLEVVATPSATQIEATATLAVAAGQPISTTQTTGWQLAPATASTVWTPGGGAPTVLAGSKLSENYIMDDRRQFDLALLERLM